MPSRRTTLGPVNSNRRMSGIGGGGNEDFGIGGAAASMQKKKSTRGRQSMLPRMSGESTPLHLSASPSPSRTPTMNTGRSGGRKSVGNSRRQSFVPPPQPPQKSDPRPIGEKAYQNSCMKKLLQYLMSAGYDHPVSHKALARPSGKDFSNIVTFLLRQIDPTFHTGTMKFEDEVVMHFKALGYPFPISKTALVAAGSPHTWPALLAALTWLMELLQSTEDVPFEAELQPSEGTFESLEDLEQKTDKAFFVYLAGAYTAFLNGDNETSEVLEEGLVDMFENDNMIIEKEIERVTDLNGQIVDRVNGLNSQSQDLPSLEKKREEYASDLEQFLDLVRQMDEHKDAIDQKVKKNAAELQEINLRLETITSRVDELKNHVQSQEYSVEDARRMQTEQNRLEKAMEQFVELKQKHSKESFDADLELTRLTEELETVIVEYNAKVVDLPLQQDLKDVKMEFNKHYAQERDQRLLLGVDLQRIIVPAIQQCKKEYSDDTHAAKRHHQELLDQLETSEAAATEALDSLKIIQAKQSKVTEAHSTEKSEQEGALAVRLREVESAETKIASLRDPVALEEAIVRYQRQCIQLEALQVKHLEDNIARKNAVREEIKTAMVFVEEHFQHQKEKLAELEQYLSNKQESLGTVALPSSLDVEVE